MALARRFFLLLSNLLLGICVGVPSLAHAQVAVAPLWQEDNATERDLAAQVVAPLSSRWRMLSPQLGFDAVRACKDDVACMRDVARRQQASHLVVLSVASLGAREEVVAVQLFAVGSGAKLFEKSVVTSTVGRNPAVAKLGEQLREIEGPPLLSTAPSSPVMASPSLFTILGGVALGVGVLAAATGAVATTVVISNPNVHDPSAPVLPIVLSAAATSLCVVAGFALLSLEPLQARQAPDPASSTSH